jgi:hypothetical protein
MAGGAGYGEAVVAQVVRRRPYILHRVLPAALRRPHHYPHARLLRRVRRVVMYTSAAVAVFYD